MRHRVPDLVRTVRATQKELEALHAEFQQLDTRTDGAYIYTWRPLALAQQLDTWLTNLIEAFPPPPRR